MKDYTDFAYFKHENTYKYFNKASQSIDDRTVVFVEDSGKIYTHGGEFGGKTIYNGGDGIRIDEADTISINTSWLDSRIREVAPEQNTFELEAATDSKLGGIMVGYTPNGKNYPVKLNGARAYVEVDWTDTKPDVTKQYVDNSVNSLKTRLNNIVSEINWVDIFNQYGNQSDNAGSDVDKIKGIITNWVKSDDGRNIVWQQLLAENNNHKPQWVSVVATNYENWVTGTQIQQLDDQISLIAGNFDANGDPIAGKWAGIILTAEDEDGHSVIDLAAEKVIAQNELIAPEVIANKIKSVDVELDGRLTAHNADIEGDVKANTFIAGNGNATIETSGDKIVFKFGGQERAFFTQGQNGVGMQLHVMGEDGEWYIIDFTNWTRVNSSVQSRTLYKLSNSVDGNPLKPVENVVVYVSQSGKYYLDSSLNNPITDDQQYYTIENNGLIIDSEVNPNEIISAVIYKPIDFSNGEQQNNSLRGKCIITKNDNNHSYVYVTNTTEFSYNTPNEQLYIDGNAVSNNSETFEQGYSISNAKTASQFSEQKTEFTGDITVVKINGENLITENYTV